MIQPLGTCLWFNGNAREAAEFYCSIFPNSAISSANEWVVAFNLNGRAFQALNGGPQFSFNESISFVVTCENQQELDLYWNRLTSDGGREGQCGWCTDRFGISWQVVPVQLGQLMADPVRRTHAMAAFRGMTKIILADLT